MLTDRVNNPIPRHFAREYMITFSFTSFIYLIFAQQWDKNCKL